MELEIIRRHLILRMMKPQLEISTSILTECLLYQLRIQTVDLNVNFHNTIFIIHISSIIRNTYA